MMICLRVFLWLWFFAQPSSLVDRFYQERHGRLFWFAAEGAAAEGRRQLLACIDSAAWLGLDSGKYHPEELRAFDGRVGGEAGGPGNVMTADRLYTTVALAFLGDVLCGAEIGKMVSYDGVSPEFRLRDEDSILAALTSSVRFHEVVERLQPATARYATLRAALGYALEAGSIDTVARLSMALNAYRWIHHFHFNRFVFVNIPSATLRYYVADTMALRMRIVAGQVSKRTPRFAAWIDGLVLFPYWNIPRKIATHEFLPMLKKAPAAAGFMRIQVLDGRGRQIDPASVDWKALHADDFPYTLRQAPGCENALGVLKFNINSPYDVYMHDTNMRRAFGSSWRYLSHGCIRLEKPFELGELLLNHQLDTVKLNSCLRDQQPVNIALRPRVPVFVLYSTVETAFDDNLTWFKDVYHIRP